MVLIAEHNIYMARVINKWELSWKEETLLIGRFHLGVSTPDELNFLREMGRNEEVNTCIQMILRSYAEEDATREKREFDGCRIEAFIRL
jgi:hypothetical protein